MNITLERIFYDAIYGASKPKDKMIWGVKTTKELVLEIIKDSKNKSDLIRKIKEM